MKVLTTLMLSTALLSSGSAFAEDDYKKHKRGDHYEQRDDHKRFHGDDQRFYKHSKKGGKSDRFFCDDHKRHHDYSDFRRYHNGGDTALFRKHLHGRKDYGWAKHHRGGRHGEVLRLDIPVAIRGDERIRLGRLVRERYGVNPRDYYLRKVVVTNRAHRRSAARIRIGDDVSRVTYLNRGENHLRAPRGDQYGRWVLGVENARISNIRVVLEPRNQWAYRDHRTPLRPWFSDRRVGWINR